MIATKKNEFFFRIIVNKLMIMPIVRMVISDILCFFAPQTEDFMKERLFKRKICSVVFIRPGYCGDIWCIPRTSQRIRKPLCYRHTWFLFYDEVEYKYIHNLS